MLACSRPSLIVWEEITMMPLVVIVSSCTVDFSRRLYP